ncbi:MAG: PIG-L family deacetylase [Pseudomonadota bacterium]
MSALRFRTLIDSILTYPRYLGVIKPKLMNAREAHLAPLLQAYNAGWWPKALEVPVAKRILVLAPHPDDESIGCGGFLLAHKGHADVRVVNVYNGDGGGQLDGESVSSSPDYRERLARARASELDAAAEMLGASQVDRLDVSDVDGVPAEKEREFLRQVLSTFQPQVVLLPWLLDSHQHHKEVNALYACVGDNCDAMVLAYEIWSLLTPNAYVDISEVSLQKEKLISIYQTQLRTVDYISLSNGLAKVRAFQCSARPDRSGAVEAYMALPSKDYCELVRACYGAGSDVP